MGYGDGYRYVDLIYNRAGIVNQIHGCTYANALDNPFVVTNDGGSYCCKYLGEVVAKFDILDASSVRRAFAVVDAISNAVWLLRRSGCLVCR